MWQVNIQIGNMPLGLGLRADGSVVVWPGQNLGRGIMDLQIENEAWAIFWSTEFAIFTTDNEESLSYNVAYPLSEYPALKQWLKQQNLIYPDFKETQ
jgi:hypothetical protein